MIADNKRRKFIFHKFFKKLEQQLKKRKLLEKKER
tara:strand:+ start:214 stop:318 length:105 start_codon:yes stop_codon:yes gene_type:complete